MEQIFIFIILVAICCICIVISIFRFITFRNNERIEKELKDLSEEELWKKWFKINKLVYGNKFEPYKKPKKHLVIYHNLVVKELDRRDLLSLEPVKEQEYADSLKEMTMNILVYNAFMRQWSLLNKESEHPRKEAVYFALIREELIKRYKAEYAKMKDEELKKSYALLLAEYKEMQISRGEYEKYLVAKSEMSKRRFVI